MQPDALPTGTDRASTMGSVAVQRRGSRHVTEFAAKVAFLSRAPSYPEGTRAVTCVETHMSWVFLTDDRAYKLKKPVRTAYVDLRDVTARLRNCAEEVRLNRRLSSDVYLAIVPLSKDKAGQLTFAPHRDVVDWLVTCGACRPSGCWIGSFLPAPCGAPISTPWSSGCATFIDRALQPLRRPPNIVAVSPRASPASGASFAGPHARSRPTWSGMSAASQLDFVSRADLLDARVRASRIIEGHGDLRPEHICIESEPQIIDCLEFSRPLRTLDPGDELGFLALECERLGAPEIGRQILDGYREQSGDAMPDTLVHFYQSYRACVRAMLAIRHLRGPAPYDPGKWCDRTKRYLDLAQVHIERCA